MEFTTWAKYINSCYYSDIHWCINTSTSMSKYKNFQILLDSRFSSTIIIGLLTTKLKKYDVMQWHTQADNLSTNLKVKIDFTLPEFSATKIVTG